MDLTPLGLGILAGGTIILGLPIARLKAVSTKTKAFLNAISTGILVFLLVEITGHILEEVEHLLISATEGFHTLPDALRFGGLLIAGFSTGLLGLVWFEQRVLKAPHTDEAPKEKAHRVAMLIAVGLGLHNLSEGLAIGQGYASGAVQLAWLLAIGFALHNGTEGFGIAAPLSGYRASWRFLGITALVAGGPTFLGALIGGLWTNQALEVFCLALASGTLLYVIGELMHLGRQLKSEAVVSIGLLIGFCVAMVTDFALVVFSGI